MKESCGNCRFYIFEEVVGDPPSIGGCRRYPASEWFESANAVTFPRTSSDNWCGEWQKKKPPNERADE